MVPIFRTEELSNLGGSLVRKDLDLCSYGVPIVGCLVPVLRPLLVFFFLIKTLKSVTETVKRLLASLGSYEHKG